MTIYCYLELFICLLLDNMVYNMFICLHTILSIFPSKLMRFVVETNTLSTAICMNRCTYIFGIKAKVINNKINDSKKGKFLKEQKNKKPKKRNEMKCKYLLKALLIFA